MLENFDNTTELKFKELSPEEKEKRGILGRLYGPIASIINPTRNQRKYTESLWEKVFSNPLTKEMYNQGGIPGELDHPVDREETCSEKIAIMMPEPPTKDKDGHLMGYFDIIDTPCGRIAYALAKYGFNLGISSRGSGDTYYGDDGEEIVDEDTYSFNAFDLVLLPACKDARLQLAESFDVKKAKFNEAIQEEMEKCDDKDKKIMSETLNNLKFYEDISTSENEEEEEEVNDEDIVADDNGTELVENLQKTLKENKVLQDKIIELQEKLSVSYTKEIKLEESINLLKHSIKRLNESVGKQEALKNQIKTLNSQLAEKCEANRKLDKLLESYKNKLTEVGTERKSLNENVETKDKQISSLRKRVNNLNESIKTIKEESNETIQSLNEEILGLKRDSRIKQEQYSRKLEENMKLVDSYKSIAKKSINKYIECKATNIGVSPSEIKNKLKENYTFSDIDTICEELRSYKRNMSKLPFNLTNNSKVTIKEDSSSNKFTNPDDVIDQNLFNLINN